MMQMSVPCYKTNICLKCEYRITTGRSQINLGSYVRNNGGYVHYGGGLTEYLEKQKRAGMLAWPTSKHI